VVEANPVGVDEHVGSLKGARELMRAVEVVWMRLNSCPERVLTLQGIRQGADSVTRSQKASCDVLAGVAECTGYDVQASAGSN
jgi:hypothetical protein